MDISAIQQSFNSNYSKDALQKKAKEASESFESFFIYQMLETMEVDVNEEFGGGFAEEMFRGVQNEHVANALVKSDTGIGIADTIYSQIMAQQEVK